MGCCKWIFSAGIWQFGERGRRLRKGGSLVCSSAADGMDTLQLKPSVACSMNNKEVGCGYSLTDLCLKVIIAVQSSSYNTCCATMWVPTVLLNIPWPD